MEIQLIQYGHPLWEKTITYAETCSWKAGPVLAERMLKNDFLDWERIAVAVDQESVAGFCAFLEKDELPESYDYSPFIGFVFVDGKHRGKRLSGRMIDYVLSYAKELGCTAVYILSGEHGLYEKYGFRKLGDFETRYGTTDQLFRKEVQ